MKSIKDAFAQLKHGPTDVVGLDVASSGVKAVRMRSHGTSVTVVAAGVLPPVAVPEKADSPVSSLDIPGKLKARYAALSFTAPGAIIKLLSFPGAFDERAEAKVTDSMGLDEPERYRVGYKVISEGHGRAESRILAVAHAEEEACRIPQLLPVGIPAPCSLEVSGLATMAAFLHFLPEKDRHTAVGVIDFGDTTTTYALFNRGMLALVRRFSFGTNALLEKVQSSLGVDRETAQGIITDGSFDISQSLNDILDPLIKQFMVSRDFVERRENCRIARLFTSGGLSRSHDAVEEIRSSMDVELETWNPFEGLTLAKDAIPPELVGQEWRLAAAVGACLATFEEA
ncbi:MAG: pilus assembly protein PilM [Lentisphaerae bacterium]|nr:pilus assembly protein PilM [Lentisphaerota bacterium]